MRNTIPGRGINQKYLEYSTEVYFKHSQVNSTWLMTGSASLDRRAIKKEKRNVREFQSNYNEW